MGKSKAATMTTFALPLGPWLYINDPMVDQPNAKALQDLLPVSASMLRSRSSTSAIIGNYTDGTFKDSVNLIVDDRDDDENHSKIKTANEYRLATIKYGCNFVSINLYLRSASTKTEAWGTNHLDLCIDDMEADVVANSIYKSLCMLSPTQLDDDSLIRYSQDLHSHRTPPPDPGERDAGH